MRNGPGQQTLAVRYSKAWDSRPYKKIIKTSPPNTPNTTVFIGL
jgi:hypothetical protein